MVTSRLSTAPYPPDLIAAVNAQAVEDARLVVLFIDSFENHLGILRSPDTPRSFPFDFLVHLAAALRIFVWESQGLRLHLDAGLPDSDTAFHDAFFPEAGLNVPPGKLMSRVIGLLMNRLAWGARPVLGADVVLGDIDDHDLDAALDCLAKLLWTQRHHFRTT
jgi:hypothetical protein